MPILNCLPRRYVFAIAGFLVTLVAYMMKISVEVTASTMFNQSVTIPLHDPYSCPDRVLANQTNTDVVQDLKPGMLDWEESEQARGSSAFATGYIITQLLGGMVAERSGGKKIMAIALGMLSVSTFAIPFSSKLMGSTAMFLLRFISGLASGPIIPIMLSMMSKWAPRDEQAFIAAIIFPGSLIGYVAGTSLGNLMVTTVNWESVFYTFGSFGIVCCALWTFLVYSTPNEHPTISDSEKSYLNQNLLSLQRTTKYDLDPVPFKALLKCGGLWGIIMGYIGREWAFKVFTTEVPQLMRDVLWFDINDNPLFVYMPYILMWVAALMCGFICDLLISKQICSVKIARKIFTSFGTLTSIFCIILLMYSGCNPVLAVFCMFAGMTVLGAFYSGCMIGALDIAPNYAGSMVGIADNISINTVKLLPSLNAWIISDALLRQWRISLWVVVVVLVLCIAVYLYFMQAEQMWWDDVRTNGYPEDWKSGLLSCEGLIDKNGKSIYKENDKLERLDSSDGDF